MKVEIGDLQFKSELRNERTKKKRTKKEKKAVGSITEEFQYPTIPVFEKVPGYVVIEILLRLLDIGPKPFQSRHDKKKNRIPPTFLSFET